VPSATQVSRAPSGGIDKQFAQGTYRFKADGSALEFLHQFTNNTWGQSINQYGDQFRRHSQQCTHLLWRHPCLDRPQRRRAMTAKRINSEDKDHTITPNFRQVDVMGGYTAAAGSAFIYSDQLPARLQGKAMICEPTMKNIALFDVVRDGAGYIANDAFPLVASSDESDVPGLRGSRAGRRRLVLRLAKLHHRRHNPTPTVGRGGYDAKTGVGGAHGNPLRDHSRGRIYRVVWDQAKPAKITSSKGATTAQLVSALADGNQFWRLTAQRLLVEGKHTDAAPALKQSVAASAGVPAIHALWTLDGLGQLDDATHRIALNHPDAAVRRNATRALGTDARAVALYFGSSVVSDPDALTRLAALVKLARFSETKQIQTVVASLVRNTANQSDEWLKEATRILGRIHGAALYRNGDNMIAASGFETNAPDGLPTGWQRRDTSTREGNKTATWSAATGEKEFRGGKQAVRIAAASDADTTLYTEVTVKPNTQYRLAGWIKTKGLSGRINLGETLGKD